MSDELAWEIIENLSEELARKEERIMKLEEKERKYNLQKHKEYIKSRDFIFEIKKRTRPRHERITEDFNQTEWEDIFEQSMKMGVRPGVSREVLLEGQRVIGLHCGIIL